MGLPLPRGGPGMPDAGMQLARLKDSLRRSNTKRFYVEVAIGTGTMGESC